MSGRTMRQAYCVKWHNILEKRCTNIQGAHAPLLPHKTQRDKVLAVFLQSHYPLFREAIETCRRWIITKAWAECWVHNLADGIYETSSTVLQCFHVPQNANHQSSDIQVATQFTLGQHRQLVWRSLPRGLLPPLRIEPSISCLQDECTKLLTAPQE